ncbi:two-component sensor histidine kinase [Arthrobacter sp. SRS-W-1-2016]|uniref:sensor histidine kinase n=1 Tax=Arthrobacter sp. SRS-W-1-2016 TaxID=1930254 RepID=UPI00099129F3|nr:HAMP domain-containing sensor histidine kinase [Arthrobacter sp. SRS-W-1-2016]OOP60952.1 two-component sensor histidine kinase [Arthrobacter sp. SRS-W-1-2016]
MTENVDQATLRKASLRIAVRISAACTVLVLCLLAAAAIYLFNQVRQPGLPGSGEPDSVYAYLDTKDLLKAMIIAGVAGIFLAGGIGWLSARSAIRPLGEALALQRRFVQDASHELRTPLAILDARVQLAQRHTGPDSQTGQALTRIRNDTATLTGIVNELLVAATGSPPDAASEPSDLAHVAAAVVESVQQLAGAKDVRVTLTEKDRPFALIDSNGFRRALLALADNALAHTPAGGQVGITTAVLGNRAVVTVSDSGAGIKGVDQTRIFDRFVRTHHPEGHSPEGTMGQRSFGIGLALVREIITGAGGTVGVERSGPRGTTMKITLPLAPKPGQRTRVEPGR